MKHGTQVCSAAALIALAGSLAMAVPVIDGKRTVGDNYGAAKWVNANPTGFGDNVANSTTGASLGDPAAVRSGVEIAIPWSALGSYTGGPIAFAAIISSGDSSFLSNQLIGPLAENSENLADPRDVDLGAGSFAGNQFVSTTPASAAGTVIVDGKFDVSEPYVLVPGSVQTTGTAFGNNGTATPVGGGGSELNAVYMWNDTATSTLHVLIAGNVEANGNKLHVFFETDFSEGSGQNLLAANTGPGALTRLSDQAGNGFGLRFDAGFSPEYYFNINGNGGATPAFFVDYSTTPAGGLGDSFYSGTAAYGSVDGILTGSNGGPVIRASVDNSNTAGVIGGNSGTFIEYPNPDRAGGSEFDALYAKVEGDRLFVLITGNLETNFNKAILYFDVEGVSGQNRIRGSRSAANTTFRPNVNVANNNLVRMGVEAQDTEPQDATNGLKFDADFSASYFLAITNGRSPARVFMDAAVLRTSGRLQTTGGFPLDYGTFDGGRKRSTPFSFDGPTANQQTNAPVGGLGNIFANFSPRLLAANIDTSAGSGIFPWLNNNLLAVAGNKLALQIDNSNVAGINGGFADPADALAVDTGIELSIDLRELGIDINNPIPRIRLAGFIINDPFSFMSNQVLGGLPEGALNLGEPRAVDFSNIAGNQFVQVFPDVVAFPARCNGADIAYDNGDFLPRAEIVDGTNGTPAIPGAFGGTNNGVTEADYNVFFANFFDANAVADIANDDGTSRVPTPAPGTVVNNGVTEGDYNYFFGVFFNGCSL